MPSLNPDNRGPATRRRHQARGPGHLGSVARVDLVFLHGPAAAGSSRSRGRWRRRSAPRLPQPSRRRPVDHGVPVRHGAVRAVARGVLEGGVHRRRSCRPLDLLHLRPRGDRTAGLPRAGTGRHRGRRRSVRFVRLRVSEREQERRIGLPDRSEFHKLASVETLRRIRSYSADVEQPPADLEIDTAGRTPAESAAAIVRRLGLIAEDPVERYPGAGCLTTTAVRRRAHLSPVARRRAHVAGRTEADRA